MNVGIIGCGVIGQRRASLLGDNKLVAVSDINIGKAYDVAIDYNNVKVFSDYIELLKENVDIVIVSTTNQMLAPISLDVIKSGKHLLVEKPCAVVPQELDMLIKEQKRSNVKVKVGYNIRCHPSLIEARGIIDSGLLGDIMFIRGRYGHGGRLGYEKEWRLNKFISGGGELIDQGVHLIDLSRWFLGDFVKISGSVHTYFWDMKVEDNAFVNLETENGSVAWLQVSCTEWRNLFSFEIFCKKGKIQIDGLGGSYNIERLTLYEMLPQMGVPKTIIYEYPFIDDSFKIEFDEFVKAIKNDEEVYPNLEDAREVLRIVSKIYGDNKK